MRALLVLASLAVLLALPASAHHWYSEKRDPVTRKGCCGGSDCAQLVIEPGMLTGDPLGYRLTLTVEQAQKINPSRRDGVELLIPWERVQPSEDGNFHLCLPRWNGVVQGDFYCFFAPPNT